MNKQNDAVEFICSYPPIQSAIKLDGQGGARIQLDIPESEVPNWLRSMAWRGKRMKARLEVDTVSDEVVKTNEKKRKRVNSYNP